MGAITIGPLMFSANRFAGLLAMAAFLVVAHLMSRRAGKNFAAWSWWALIACLIGARLGHVIAHAASFSEAPWRVLAFWRGGFSWPAGAVAFGLVTLFFLRERRLLLRAAVPVLAAVLAGATGYMLTTQIKPVALPEGTFTRLQGGEVSPASLAGKPLVINLWATWCPPCRREMPMMAEMVQQMPEVTFLFVNQGEGSDIINAYLQKEGILLDDVLLDPSRKFARHYRAPGLPTTLFIGSDGTLRSVHFGEISKEVLIDKVKPLLSAAAKP